VTTLFRPRKGREQWGELAAIGELTAIGELPAMANYQQLVLSSLKKILREEGVSAHKRFGLLKPFSTLIVVDSQKYVFGLIYNEIAHFQIVTATHFMSRITACDNAVSTAKRDGRAVRTSGGCFGGKLRQPVAKRGSGRRRRKTGAVAGTRVLGAASCMAGDAHACNPPNHRSRWLPRVLRKCGNSGLFRTRSDFSLFPLVLGDFFFRPSRNALLGLICDKISLF
jgi:hypothetical protein